MRFLYKQVETLNWFLCIGDCSGVLGPSGVFNPEHKKCASGLCVDRIWSHGTKQDPLENVYLQKGEKTLDKA